MSSSRLSKILRESKSLVDTKSERTQLDRELSQIASESELLKSKFNGDLGLSRTGHYFLAQSGVDTQQVGEELKALDTRITFQSSEQLIENDIHAYMQQVRKEINTETIDEGTQRTCKELLDHCKKNKHSRSRNLHRDIFENWDLDQDERMFGRASIGKEKHDKFNKQKNAYALVIKKINDKRLIAEKLDIIQEFKSVSSSVECDKTQKKFMLDAWNIASNFGKKAAIFDILHPNHHQDVSATVKMKRHMIQSAKSYLEKEFYLYIEEQLQKNARQVRVGGAPDLGRRISAFVQLEFKTGDQWKSNKLKVIENTPLWLMVYIYLRMGKHQDALKFVDKENLLFMSTAPQFPKYLKEYLESPTNLVSEDARKNILSEYQGMVYGETSPDPYKVLLYKIIGRCELQGGSNPEAINTIEDYLWFQLTLIREQVDDERYSYEKYRLADFQQKINIFGRNHFDPNNSNPWFYFKILLLSVQLEKAIDFLYGVESFRLEAVHFGIALAYNELLRLPSKSCDEYASLLIEEFDGSVHLNFVRLINQYVNLFVSDNHDSALHYFYLITLCPTEDMITLCREQICAYIIRYNAYSALLGARDANRNQASSGSLEKYTELIGINSYDLDTYRTSILSPVAQKLQWKGEYQKAVQVFELTGQYMEAFNVLNRHLDFTLDRSRHGLQLKDQKKSDEQLMEFAESVMKNYKSSIDENPSPSTLATHDILLKFLKATVYYESKRYQETIETIKSTKIFPQNEDAKTVKIAVDNFNSDSDLLIRKHVSQVLMMTMDSYDKLKQSYSRHDPSSYTYNQMNLSAIYSETAAIVAFVSLIDVRISPENIQKLNHLDGKRY